MAKLSNYAIDIDKMKALYENLKGHRPDIQVGVFQEKTARPDGPLTNADLAQTHELGAPEHGLPARSMLKVPIMDHAEEIMAPFKGKAEAYLQKGSLLNMWKLIGAAAEKVVLGAFKTDGYGKWAPLKYATLMAKLSGSLAKRKNKMGRIYAGQIGMGILIRTGELRRSFSSRVRLGT